MAIRLPAISSKSGGKIVADMDSRPQTPPAAPSPGPDNLRGLGAFSLERLLSHIDAGPAEETETFVRAIYAQRRIDAITEPKTDR